MYFYYRGYISKIYKVLFPQWIEVDAFNPTTTSDFIFTFCQLVYYRNHLLDHSGDTLVLQICHFH